MKIPRFVINTRRYRAIISIVSLFSLLNSSASVKAAPSISDLKQQQIQLQQQAEQAAQQALQQKTVAERAADSLQQVTTQISSLRSAMQDTNGQVQSVETQISNKNQEIAQLESNLRTITDQQNILLRQLYIMSLSQPDSLTIFSNQPISKRTEEQQQFKALEDAATSTYVKTKAQQSQVTVARDQLKQTHDGLTFLQSQQNTQQQVLASTQSTQKSLQNNAVVFEQEFESQAATARAQAAAISRKILVLTQTSSWGNQIVSDSPSSWYYMQTGDYTLLGRGPYTVSEVGCYITSIAMEATYYGHNITPDYIAHNGVFSDGYLVSLPAGLGITLSGAQRVNWDTVNRQISSGRPVIVSIYLPSVGAINQDGSSHFVVISGEANGRYLMQDPIGTGRGYSINQVRSMILVSPN